MHYPKHVKSFVMRERGQYGNLKGGQWACRVLVKRHLIKTKLEDHHFHKSLQFDFVSVPIKYLDRSTISDGVQILATSVTRKS